ncbi:MAG: PAS domain S-box protein [Betaproteobacteria bacterium]|nr:PAS domain S-box protein [Betaproteobacteria bacterium]
MWWLPRGALVFFLLSLGALLWISKRSDIEDQRVTLISDMLWLEQDIHFHLTRNEEQLQQLASDLAPDTARSRSFEPQARSLLANQTGLNQVAWLSASGALRVALPAPTSATVMVGEASPAIPMAETLRLARALAKPVYSPAYAVVMGDAQFEVHVPQFANGRYAGMIVATYSVRRMLDELVPWWLAERYRVSVANDGGILGSKSAVAAINSQMSYQIPFDPPGHGLILRAEAYEQKTSLARNLLIFTVMALAGAMLWSLWALRRHMQWRLAAEQALRQEYAFRTAMENSLATGLRARDLEGRIIYVNPAFCRMVGYSAEEIVGSSPPMPYWDPDFLDANQQQSASVLAGEAPTQGFESRLQHKDGHTVHTMVHAAPLIDGGGRHFGWLSSVLDITEAKRLEHHARQQEEKLQFTARLVAMGEMASSLAHELNQPLAAISSYSTGCLNRIEQADIQQSDLVEALQKIGRQAQRAGAVIRRIYAFARRSEPRQASCNLGEIIADAAGLLEAEARKHGVEIRLDISASLPRIIGDRVLLEQIFVNLIKNGVESMQFAKIRFRTLEITANYSGQDPEAQLCVSVMDHGCGIAAADLDKIFLPFFTTKPEGMGMGLNICRSIIESHHGRLWYEENPAGGSIFRLTLPAGGDLEIPA